MEGGHVAHHDGCMGGLMHLFDFNHALVPKRTITSKKTGGGAKPPQNRSKLKEVLKSNSSTRQNVQCEYEPSGASTNPRKLIGMPIRALVAPDLSKGSYMKTCTSSVVARLMGLEISKSSGTLHKTSRRNVMRHIDEKPSLKLFGENQQYNGKLQSHNVRCYTKKGKLSITSGCYKNHETEVRKQNYGGERLRNESGSVSSTNHPQEPQLQDLRKEFEAQAQEKGHSKKSSRHDKTGSHLTGKPAIQYEKLKQFNKSSDLLCFDKEKFIEEMESMSTLKFRSNYCPSSEPFEMQDQDMFADPSMGHANGYQLPTRIVVLKPSTGKESKLNSQSSNYAWALKDHVAESMHTLQRLRQNLKNCKEVGHETTREWLCANDYSRDAPKKPREIAREIARQVRENVARMNAKYADPNSNQRISNQATEPWDVVRSTDYEDFILTNRHYYQSHRRKAGSSQDRKCIMEVDAERKRNACHRSRKKVASTSDETDFLVDNIGMRKDAWYEESGYESSPSVGTSPSSKASRRHSYDGIRSGAKHRRALFRSNSQNNEELMWTYQDCEVQNLKEEYELYYEDHNRERSHRASVPNIKKTQAAIHMVDNRSHFAEPPETDLKNVHPTAVHDAIKLIDEIRSIDMPMPFHCGEQTSVMKPGSGETIVDQMISTIEGSMVLEQNGSVLVTHDEEQQCQITEDGLAVDNDGDDLSYLSDHATTPGADNAIENLGSNALCEVDYVTGTIDDIIPPDASNDEHCKLLEEIKSISSSSNKLSSNQREIKSESSLVSFLELCNEEEASASMEFEHVRLDLQECWACPEGRGDADGYEILREPEEQMTEQIMQNALQKDLGYIIDGPKDGIFCSTARASERLYVREILLAGGFLTSNTSFFLSWYAPSQPLNPDLFERIENGYMSKTTGAELGADRALGLAERRLLFDAVNQMLFHMIGPHLNHDTYLSSAQRAILAMPSSEADVFNHVWTHVDSLLRCHSDSQDTLENLVTRDMAERSQWFDVDMEVQELGLEIENAIINDLVEEILLVL